MTRHQEIRSELRKLYAASVAATSETHVLEIEAQISRLESDAATILTETGE